MYISLLELNPRSRQAQAELRDMYQMHRTLSKAFGDGDGEYKEARCLFRLDELDDGRKLCVLVQSKAPPSWNHCTFSDDYLASEPQTKEFTLVLSVGQRLAFRLRANPTVKRDGKRLGLYTKEDQIKWLNRKAEANGFRVLSVDRSPFNMTGSRTAKDLETKFVAVTFNGVLEVTDTALFAQALESGIGSAKGFGFGLLSIAPVRT